MPDEAGEALQRIHKARKNVHTADEIVEEGFLDAAIHAAYYGMFHAAMAVLALRGSHPRTHRGTHTEFARLVVKTGDVDREAMKLLEEVWDARLKADYGVIVDLEEVEAHHAVAAAKRFVELVSPLVEEAT